MRQRNGKNVGQMRDIASLTFGALAQLGERLICIQEVIGSIPIGSTKFCGKRRLYQQGHLRMCLLVQPDGLTSFREKTSVSLDMPSRVYPRASSLEAILFQV